MRCPKCGYMTFDHLETCTKCRKKIAAMSGQLSGTVFKAEAPAFLQFKVHKPGTDTDASVDLFPENNDIDVEFSLDGQEIVSDNAQVSEEIEFSLDGEEVVSDNAQVSEEIEFDFMDESQDAPASQGDEDDGGVEFDLDLFGEESVELDLDEGNTGEESVKLDLDEGDAGEESLKLDLDEGNTSEESVELDLDEGDTDVAEGKDGPQLDFSELDISDLAPPAADEDDLPSAELTLEDPASAPVASAKDPALPSMGIGGGLEDLQMDGLDLVMPSLPSADSVKGKKMRPAVKTGTALDRFDIDVGELMSDQEK